MEMGRTGNIRGRKIDIANAALRGKETTMLVDVDGVNPAFRAKVIEIVEGITEPMTF